MNAAAPASPQPPALLTIAGFDPSSGAGITADLAVFSSFGSFGISCITALTVQSTCGVLATEPVSAGLVAATLACLEADLPPGGIKIGMLANAEVAEAVAGYLDGLKRSIPIVLDPVLRSSSGCDLLDGDGLTVLTERLLPLAGWVTPNVDELAVLTGLRVDSRETAMAAARKLQMRFPDLTILATGGHLDPPDDLLLEPGGNATWLPGVRLDSRGTHGTGCALSSALLANLAGGMSPVEAARSAKEFVAEAIRRAPGLGAGNGPMNLRWPLHR